MLQTCSRVGLSYAIADVIRAADDPVAERPGAVARALSDYVGDPELLVEVSCPSSPGGYVRHLLHADPAGRFAMVALVWRPGQESPIHAHRTWCALAVHRGVLTETFFKRDPADGPPQPLTVVPRLPGQTSHGSADPNLIHRLSNLGSVDAISIHVYGTAFERFAEGVNEIYAA